MLNDRVVISPNPTPHFLFNVFSAYYPVSNAGDQPYSNHHHSQMEVSAITSGSGVYTCSGIDYPFHPGDVFFHCGNDVHSFKRIDSGERLSLLVFQFEPRMIWSLNNEWFDPAYLQIFTEQNQAKRFIPCGDECAARIVELLVECFNEYKEQEPASDILIKARLLAILAYLVRYFYDDMPNPSIQVKAQHIEHIEHSMDYIHAHLDDKLSLEMLAREAKMSRSYYATIFKTLNGVSVCSYITIQRVHKAQNLIENTELPITEISGICGFNNLVNFNRMYKKLIGKTPSESRNKGRKRGTA